jgi:phage shock protein PspC (stress-responsive transcriptional regulator)
MVAGICAGLAERTGLNAWIFRIIFIIGTFTFGPGLIAYLVMWALMPLDRS